MLYGITLQMGSGTLRIWRYKLSTTSAIPALTRCLIHALRQLHRDMLQKGRCKVTVDMSDEGRETLSEDSCIYYKGGEIK